MTIFQDTKLLFFENLVVCACEFVASKLNENDKMQDTCGTPKKILGEPVQKVF